MASPATLDAPATAPAHPGPTAAERFTFDNTGYLVLERFLKPDHIARLLTALERAVRRRRAQVAADPAYARNTLINGARSTRLLYILEDDPLFLELVDWAPLMPYVHALINPMPHYHASDAIVEQGSELLERKGGWRIDGNDQGYRGLRAEIPLLQLKVGYYLTDMTQPGNGNLTVVPSSHKARQIPSAKDLEAQLTQPRRGAGVCAGGQRHFVSQRAHARGRAVRLADPPPHDALLCLRAPLDDRRAGALELRQGFLQPPPVARAAQVLPRFSLRSTRAAVGVK